MLDTELVKEPSFCFIVFQCFFPSDSLISMLMFISFLMLILGFISPLFLLVEAEVIDLRPF